MPDTENDTANAAARGAQGDGGAGPALSTPALSGIRRLSALDTVRARIAMAVDLGLLAPGERLPPTAEIAAALDVGEITVRRALVALCDDGLLERRRGRNGGTLVAEHPARDAVGAVGTYRSDTAAVRRLIDHRLVLECGIAHLAAGRAGEPALRELDALVDRMDRATGWAEFHSCDERFHLAVAAATGVAAAVDPYAAVVRDLYRYYLPYPMAALRASNEEHRALVRALRKGDAAAAAEVARHHVESLHRTMFIGLAQAGDPVAGP
ncbi:MULTISPECIES: FadR/GntR family transcriptional regulator [unclassified Streptomyces]|uniref:FadR/GntR family transcriptional regulator n=1 Tax=unclassified Streptomyces TaxID=2593676 RepID=UPI00380B3A6D